MGDGEGVSVGDVLLEVEEFPDGGRFTISIFFGKCPLLVGRTAGCSGGVDPQVVVTRLCGTVSFCFDKEAAFRLCAAI